MIRPYVDSSEGHPAEDDVYDALDYLIAIEPDPQPSTSAEYRAALAPYQADIVRAVSTIRAFAESLQPPTLETMRSHYYEFTNDQRYRTSTEVTGTVIAYLNEAWHGVGPWRR